MAIKLTNAEKARCVEIFNKFLNEGVNGDQIVAGSSAYAQRVLDTGETPLSLPDWLLTRGWEKHLH